MHELHSTDDYCYIVPNDTAVITQCKIHNKEIINIPETIEGYRVTELYETACEYLNATEIFLPEGLEIIGVLAFKNCSSLKKIHLPSTLKRIMSYAFDSCISLETIYLPDHVILVAQAFSKCTKLRSIEVSDSNDTYYSVGGVLYIKDDCRLALYPLGKENEEFHIDERTVSIVPYVFAFNVYLKRIYLPDNYKEINDGAFAMAAALEEVVIPDSVTKIGVQAFAHCISLAHIKLPPKLKSINKEAFAQSGLLEIDIPKGTEIIENKAFFNCEKLKSVKLKSSIQKIAEEAFAKCTALDDIELSWGRMSFVNPMAFAACISLKEIKFPECMIVTPGLFVSCRSLETVYLNDKVIHIGQQSFAGCSSLKKIYIFDSTMEIDDNAFYRCDSLTEVIYSGSEEQWNNIKISSAGNEALQKAKVVFRQN
ncbi:leucine-rich repeat domain-containing protein [Ruminococcus sp.]|uniref:leucine-rich repeat domain-containing protein n=1 Tax=Ruminococcus sp. TaxID=41978 RepID=UPI0025DA920F|nr:leucine-rich repeat domain-containing protein [Ruminococcus sp.]MBR1432704.1 leucine-rich repeat domain-containing protein [Ruminococcus sp.]